MAKRKRKAPPTDPEHAGLQAVEQATADEAEILREIADSDKNREKRVRPKKRTATKPKR